MNEIKVIQSEPGKEIIVRVVHSRFNEDAWIGLFKAGSGDNEHGDRWKWMRDVDVSHITLPAQGAGEWSVRLFKDGGFERISSLDFHVTNCDFIPINMHPITDQADDERRDALRASFVVGITLFSMGLPLLIIGATSTAEDRLAMLIPGAVIFCIGAFVTVAAAIGMNLKATNSELDMDQQRRGSDIEILEAVPGKPVRFRINNRPSSNDAWVGIYPMGASDQDHGAQNERWKYIRDIDVNNASLPGHAKGRWSIRVFSDGGYTLHDRVDFDIVDDNLTEVWMQNARIDDNRLIGMALEHPKHGTTNVTTSPIVKRSRQGEVNRFETFNTIYLIYDRDLQDEEISDNSNQLSSGKYVFVPEQMTWNEHSHRAQAMGGHLASITNGIENEQITRISGGAPVWIGGIRKGSDNGPGADHWYWSDGRPWSYTNWNPGEPNNYGGHENRVHLGLQARGTWNDVPEGWSGPAVYLVPIIASASTTSARPSSPPEIDLLEFFRSKLEQSKPADSGVPEFSSYLTKK